MIKTDIVLSLLPETRMIFFSSCEIQLETAVFYNKHPSHLPSHGGIISFKQETVAVKCQCFWFVQ